MFWFDGLSSIAAEARTRAPHCQPADDASEASLCTKPPLSHSTVTLSAFIWSLTTAAEPSMSSCLVSRLFSFEFGCLAVVTLCSSLQNTPTPTPNLSTLSQICFVYRKMQENPLHTDWPKYGTPWNLHMQACVICMEHQSFIKQREEQLTA